MATKEHTPIINVSKNQEFNGNNDIPSISKELKELIINNGGTVTKDDDSVAELLSILKGMSLGGGGSSSVLVVNTTSSDDIITMDKTWQEIYEAMPLVIAYADMGDTREAQLIIRVYIDGGAYRVVAGDTLYYASSADDYPITTQEK